MVGYVEVDFDDYNIGDIVYCIGVLPYRNSCVNLTTHKEYRIVAMVNNGMLCVINDLGSREWFNRVRFTKDISKLRSSVIDSVLG